jgi:hypothetical protein
MSWAIISKLIETTLKQCLFLAQWNYICVIQTTIISNPMEQKNQPQLFVTQWNTKSTTQLFLASWMANKCNHNHFEGVSGRKGFSRCDLSISNHEGCNKLSLLFGLCQLVLSFTFTLSLLLLHLSFLFLIIAWWALSLSLPDFFHIQISHISMYHRSLGSVSMFAKRII